MIIISNLLVLRYLLKIVKIKYIKCGKQQRRNEKDEEL